MHSENMAKVKPKIFIPSASVSFYQRIWCYINFYLYCIVQCGDNIGNAIEKNLTNKLL